MMSETDNGHKRLSTVRTMAFCLTKEGSCSEALSIDDKYLYVLNSLTYEIIGLRVNNFDGSLEPFTRDGGLPTYAFGLAAR